MKKLPIIYVRGYAGSQGEVEQTVDDPFYGFNVGSTHVRVDEQGRADFYVFESPFVRLLTDHQYVDVYDGAMQTALGCPTPAQTIWIYRYYDPTSKTYDRPGGRRLSIEEAADGLRDFIEDVRRQTSAPRVILIAHSMGGLVCRSLIQKIYPDRGQQTRDHIDKLFTYGTPHGGIHFERGSGIIERVRDAIGANNSDDFGRRRMYEYLTPRSRTQPQPPDDFREDEMPADAFDVERVFCIVGTNAGDYEAAMGLSRSLVGPQSDGLVQIQWAAVRGAHRAFIHRSHSGRYGMVNSDEGYQNLQRFLFGDVRVKMVLCDFALDFTPPGNEPNVEVTYQFELQVAIKGLPIVMHERRHRALQSGQPQPRGVPAPGRPRPAALHQLPGRHLSRRRHRDVHAADCGLQAGISQGHLPLPRSHRAAAGLVRLPGGRSQAVAIGRGAVLRGALRLGVADDHARSAGDAGAGEPGSTRRPRAAARARTAGARRRRESAVRND